MRGGRRRVAEIEMNLIDLTTKNSELECVILEEYPGIIYEGQYSLSGTRDDRTYWFYDLEENEIIRFLKDKGYGWKIEDEIIIV